MDETTPGYQLSAPRRSTRGLRVVLVSAIIVAMLALGYLMFVMKMPFPGVVGEYLSALSYPVELTGVTFISDRGSDGSVLYTHKDSAFENEKLIGSLVSATQSIAGSAQVVEVTDGAYKVLLDGSVVIQDGQPRSGIARSPGGTRIAFAQPLDEGMFVSPADAPLFLLDRDRWQVMVYESSTKTFTTLGKGASPFFVDETHVAWIAPAGLAMTDLVSGETTMLASEMGGRVPMVSLVSPDRTLVAWYAAGSKNLVLYRVTLAGAQPLPQVALPTPLRSLALGNDAVYLVRSVPTGAEVIKLPLEGGGAETMLRVPESMHINRLLFGSI